MEFIPILEIPNELLVEIAALLQVSDMLTMRAVCSEWRKILDDSYLWRQLYRRRWPESEHRMENCKDVGQLFRERHRLTEAFDNGFWTMTTQPLPSYDWAIPGKAALRVCANNAGKPVIVAKHESVVLVGNQKNGRWDFTVLPNFPAVAQAGAYGNSSLDPETGIFVAEATVAQDPRVLRLVNVHSTRRQATFLHPTVVRSIQTQAGVVVTADTDGVNIFNIATTQRIRDIPCPGVNRVRIGVGCIAVTGCDADERDFVRIWDMRTKDFVQAVEPPRGLGTSVMTLHASHNLVVGCNGLVEYDVRNLGAGVIKRTPAVSQEIAEAQRYAAVTAVPEMGYVARRANGHMVFMDRTLTPLYRVVEGGLGFVGAYLPELAGSPLGIYTLSADGVMTTWAPDLGARRATTATKLMSAGLNFGGEDLRLRIPSSGFPTRRAPSVVVRPLGWNGVEMQAPASPTAAAS